LAQVLELERATDVSSAEITAAVAKFGTARSPQQMTVQEAANLSVALAEASTNEGGSFDFVVGIANGALLPTKVVADTLDLPYRIVRVRRQGSRYKQRLLRLAEFLHIPVSSLRWGPTKPLVDLFQNLTGKLEEAPEPYPFDVSGKRVLVVDDAVVTGATLKHVCDKLLAAGASEALTAAICWCDVPDRDVPKPSFHLHRQIHIYPWAGDTHCGADYKTWLERNGLSVWE
jgi:hypoxanthine phosphoribosyltransferase